MRHFDFSRDVLDEIERDRFQHLDPVVQRRMEALWLKAHGEKHRRIASLSGLDMYESGGLAAVRTFHWKIPASALEPHRPLLEAEFRERPPHTVAEACERIERLTGVRRSQTHRWSVPCPFYPFLQLQNAFSLSPRWCFKFHFFVVSSASSRQMKKGSVCFLK